MENKQYAHEHARVIGAYKSGDGPGPGIMAADTLQGDEVKNAGGDTLGTIEHIMIDVASGHVAYAVMSFGGFLGIGEKLFAVPWTALILNAADKCFMLDVDKQRLKDAPGFDKDHWPSFADRQFATDLHTYYNSRPYWEQPL